MGKASDNGTGRTDGERGSQKRRKRDCKEEGEEGEKMKMMMKMMTQVMQLYPSLIHHTIRNKSYNNYNQHFILWTRFNNTVFNYYRSHLGQTENCRYNWHQLILQQSTVLFFTILMAIRQSLYKWYHLHLFVEIPIKTLKGTSHHQSYMQWCFIYQWLTFIRL